MLDDEFIDLDVLLDSKEFKDEMKKCSFIEDDEEINYINDVNSIYTEMTDYERFVL